jgi:phage-related protein
MKPIRFLGSSRDDLRTFPAEVRRDFGEQLLRVQLGLAPVDFKPMPDVGSGVFEIRVHVRGAWRLLYVAKFDDAIYVLHAFEKKTQRTPRSDLELASKRYRMIGDKS